PVAIERGAGGELALNAAAELLAAAQFPVILCGGGVIMADGQAEAIRLAELLQAPVCNSYLHNDSFPASHPLWCGALGYQGSKAAMKLIAKADVELALGKRLACHANKDARLAAFASEKTAWEAELDGWKHETDSWSLEVSESSSHMHPRQMLRELERAMPAGAMVSTDIGNICSVANSYL